MRIIYEADDGMQFNTAEECGHYEYKSSILLDQEKFLCFDEMLHPIKLCKGYNFAEVIANTYFFICFTKEAAEAFQEKVNEVCEKDLFPYIRKNVFYGWAVDGRDCWNDVWEVIKELEEQANYLCRVVRDMNGEIEKTKQGK